MRKQSRNHLLTACAASLTLALMLGAWHGGAEKIESPKASDTRRTENPAAQTESGSLAALIQTARYAVERRDGKIYAQNPANQMRGVFDDAGNFQIQGANKTDSWQTDWRLKSVGYGERQTTVRTGEIDSNGSRAERRTESGDLIEYFENRPEGIEQGFVLNRRPDGETASEPLQVVLETTGDFEARATADNQKIEMFDASGAKILSYEKLKVWDANDNPLVARMSVVDNQIRLEVADREAIYPITIDPTFVRQQRLAASDGGANDAFGTSISIVGNYAVVGAPFDDIGADADQGSAYVFQKIGTTWTQKQKLISTDGLANDRFGSSVSINFDERILVGAPLDDVGANADQGSVYDFTYFSGQDNWVQTRRLSTTNGAAGDNFGASVTNLNYFVIGAPGRSSERGAIHLFNEDSTVVDLIISATASDGAAGDRFGSSLATLLTQNGSSLVVGAPLDDLTGGTDQGSAYIFEVTATNLIQRIKATASDGASGDQLGTSVIGRGTTGNFCLGAPLDDINANADQGSVYLFLYDALGITQQAKLTATDGAAGDNFGASLGNFTSLGSSRIIVGAPGDDVGANADEGSVYAFLRDNTTAAWLQNARFNAPDGAAGDAFGSSIGVSGRTIVVGAKNDDVAVNANQGSAHVLSGSAPGDFDGDGTTDFAVFRPSTARWYANSSPNNSPQLLNQQFGLSTDTITPADYDGDNRTDMAVFRASSGTWYLQQTTGGFLGTQFGQNGDLPRPGDFDGDGKADLCVFRPANGVWYRTNSSNGQFVATQFGLSGDRPVIADFDADGKTDLAVYRPSNGFWYWLNSSDGQFAAVQFGINTDVPFPADYDGDGKVDLAVWRSGVWYIQQSTLGFAAFNFGISTDIPMSGDPLGSGKFSFGVFRPSNGYFYWRTIDGINSGVQFGTNGDRPIPAAFN